LRRDRPEQVKKLLKEIAMMLYAIENWGGIYAAAFWEEEEPGRMVPVWKENINRAEFVELRDRFEPFAESDQQTTSITYYDLDAQLAAIRVAELAADLDEKNEMAAAAGRGIL
jgi:hypothetical protein